MRTYQKYDIKSRHTDINNEETIVLYDSKSAVSYINTDCELHLKAFNGTNDIEQNDGKILTIPECNNLSNMIFRRKRDSANYLVISTAYLIKSSLNILKEDNDLKEKELRLYTSIRSTHIMKIILCKRKMVTIIHREYKENYIIRDL